jgi:hypothetical protein
MKRIMLAIVILILSLTPVSAQQIPRSVRERQLILTDFSVS